MGLYRSALTLHDVEAIFRRQQWHYDLVDAHILTVFDEVVLVISIDEDREIVLIEVPLVSGDALLATQPSLADAELHAAIYMLSANYRLALGAFARDHRDGEIRYEVSLPVTGSLLSDDQLRAAILIAVTAVTHHAPIIAGLLTGRLSLQQALAQIDAGRDIPPAMAV